MAKKKIFRGGVIPYYFDDDGQLWMLFMKPAMKKYGGDVYQLAKGKIEEGEDEEEGAFREAKEELGLFKPNTKNRNKLGTFMGRTTIYTAEVIDPDDDKFGKPHFETQNTKWMTPEMFQADGRDLHKPVVKAAVRFIEKTIKENDTKEE